MKQKDAAVAEHDVVLVVRTFGAAVAVAEGCAEYAILLGVNLYAVVLMLGIGVTLVAYRAAFLFFAPFMLAHGKVFVFIINNFAIFALNIVINAFILAIDIIVAAIDYLPGVDVKEPSFVDIPDVTYAEFEKTMREIVQTCSKVDSLPSMWEFAVAPSVCPATCPMFRVMHPVPGFANAAAPLIGTITYDPDPMGNNCVPHGRFVDSQAPIALCTVLASGFVVLEVLIPLLLIGLLLLALASPLKSMVWDAALLTIAGAQAAARVLGMVAHGAAGALGTMTSSNHGKRAARASSVEAQR